jgi:hypothetical protein
MSHCDLSANFYVALVQNLRGPLDKKSLALLYKYRMTAFWKSRPAFGDESWKRYNGTHFFPPLIWHFGELHGSAFSKSQMLWSPAPPRAFLTWNGQLSPQNLAYCRCTALRIEDSDITLSPTSWMMVIGTGYRVDDIPCSCIIEERIIIS